MKILEKAETILEYKVNAGLEGMSLAASHEYTSSYDWRTTTTGSYILTRHFKFSANVKESDIMLIFYQSRLEIEINTENEEKDIEEIALVVKESDKTMVDFITKNSLSYSPVIGLEYYNFEEFPFISVRNSYQTLKSLPAFDEETDEVKKMRLFMSKKGQNLNIKFKD
ncbi:hypothetical protein [Mucilaginibacter ginsenosidivorax]|uniref:Uncharacterized protein n=1 Tax=Mucilaginibacter ginsenosidivorax TaxID=862126 RepID=A0A5B8W4C0_9SPHI|nr:hypothetical protein [Mucilaginibacter ginsenosidivorax]QEC78920.1 hypothetical protein FSB76_24315 [Mucilaginibacter ginsenosidivorax]